MLKHLFQSTGNDNFKLAVIAMLFGLVCLSLQDALVKMISDQTTLWQLQLMRAVVNIVLVLTISKRFMPDLSLMPKRPGAVALRSSCQVGALTFFFGGAPFLSLAQMAGGLYTFPLFVGILGIIFGERVGPRRIIAILIGFVGTMLVIKPSSNDFTPMALMPVAAGFCYALFVITTRKLCRDESPLALVLNANIMIAVGGILGFIIIPLLPLTDAVRAQNPFLLTTSLSVVQIVVWVIVGCAVLNTIGNLCMSKAYQSADSTLLAPIDYSYLLFATAWGVVLLGDIPNATTVLGLLLIAGAGVFVAWRERVLAQSVAAQNLGQNLDQEMAKDKSNG